MSAVTSRLGVLRLVCLILLAPAGAAGASCASASAESAFTWSAPVALDSSSTLPSVSCVAGAQLCAAIASDGTVFTSTTAGAPAWTAATIDAGESLTAVSCTSSASSDFCAATDSAGNVLTSADPTGGPPAWTTTAIDPGRDLTAISCSPSATSPFCAATDSEGNVATSSNPAGGAAAWSTVAIDEGGDLTAVSCPSDAFCAATDTAGQLIATPTPQGPWYTFGIDSGTSLTGLSCPSASQCVAADADGRILVVNTSTPTTGLGWTPSVADPGYALTGVSCEASLSCVAVDAAGGELDTPSASADPWSRSVVDPSGSLSAVSCASALACVAVDRSGFAISGAVLAPTNVGPPGITGVAEPGSALGATPGTWTGDPTSYAYQWLRCDTAGSGCAPVPGAVSASYQVTAADYDSTLEVQVVAANALGSGPPALSPVTTAIYEYPVSVTIPNPGANIMPGQLPSSCASPTSASCENAEIYYLDQARRELGLGPYDLPQDFVTLTPVEQLFILTNLDREAYSVAPIAGLTSALDSASSLGVADDDDPSDPTGGDYSANWAGAYANALAAYFGWMYDDGYGSGNLDCKAPSDAGCWGHRQDVFAFDTPDGVTMGADAGTDRSGAAGYAMLVAWSLPPIGGPFVYAWSQAVADGAGTNPYDPGVPDLAPPTVSPKTPSTGTPRKVDLVVSLKFSSRARTLRVSFHSGVHGSAYTCILHGPHGRLVRSSCRSPKTYARVADGRYSLSVQDRTQGRLVATRTVSFTIVRR
jgi:hypothetical protein